MILSQTTQPVLGPEWTPNAIAQALLLVMGGFATILAPALVLLWKAVKNSAEAKTQSEANSKQISENRTVATSQLQNITNKVIEVAQSQTPVPPKLNPPDFENFHNAGKPNE